MPDYQPKLRTERQRNIASPANDSVEFKRVPILDLIKSDEPQDNLASEEAVALASGNLEEKATQNAHHRSEVAKGHVHLLAIGILWTAGLGMMAMVFAWFFHMVAPVAWHFLPQEALSKIETFLLSSAVVSGFRHYLTKHM